MLEGSHFVAVLAALFVVSAVSASFDVQVERWSDAAFHWLQRDCHRCFQHKSQARLYVAKPHHKGRLRVISADGGSRHAGLHDSVLVIDPRPEQPLGHPLFMFFVDLNVSREHCEARAGVLLEGGDCLLEWRRPRCHRRLPPRHHCSLLYPPEVRLAHRSSTQDLLTCSDLWAPCPQTRGGPQANGPCDPLATNGKGCRAALASPCVFMRTCHHAVILSGGWNRQLADEQSFQNVIKINRMLKKNGFSESNIQNFLANGLSQREELHARELSNVYPSSLKFAFRYHLKSLCETKHCSNTLFIYLNSPATPDGTSLLWDASGNGEYDESEAYTAKELLSDISSCRSKRLVLVVDQAYSAEIVKTMKKHSSAFKQTLVLVPGEEEVRGSLAGRLASLESWQCVSGLRKEGGWSGDAALDNVTLAGVPCDSGPADGAPSTCQNLSTFEMLEPEQVIDVI